MQATLLVDLVWVKGCTKIINLAEKFPRISLGHFSTNTGEIALQPEGLDRSKCKQPEGLHKEM